LGGARPACASEEEICVSGAAGEGKRDGGTVLLLLKGFLIGVANIIPGVSGGTFALTLGLFERLVGALNKLGWRTAKVFLGLALGGFRPEARRAFAEEWRRTDMWFLMRVGIGAVAAIKVCSHLLEWLLVEHPGVTLSFFLGLIIPSLAVPWGMMYRRRVRDLLWLLPGIALTVGVSLAFREGKPVQAVVNAQQLAVAFVDGVIGICAMILPGISGSFVLLALGEYPKILIHLNELAPLSILWLACFGLGCVAGLLAFARFLNFILARWRSATLAFLIGLVLGSFWALWPFKDFGAGAEVKGRGTAVKKDIKVATAPQRLPESWGEFGACAAALALGLGGALGTEVLGKRARGRGEPARPE